MATELASFAKDDAERIASAVRKVEAMTGAPGQGQSITTPVVNIAANVRGPGSVATARTLRFGEVQDAPEQQISDNTWTVVVKPINPINGDYLSEPTCRVTLGTFPNVASFSDLRDMGDAFGGDVLSAGRIPYLLDGNSGGTLGAAINVPAFSVWYSGSSQTKVGVGWRIICDTNITAESNDFGDIVLKTPTSVQTVEGDGTWTQSVAVDGWFKVEHIGPSSTTTDHETADFATAATSLTLTSRKVQVDAKGHVYGIATGCNTTTLQGDGSWIELTDGETITHKDVPGSEYATNTTGFLLTDYGSGTAQLTSATWRQFTNGHHVLVKGGTQTVSLALPTAGSVGGILIHQAGEDPEWSEPTTTNKTQIWYRNATGTVTALQVDPSSILYVDSSGTLQYLARPTTTNGTRYALTWRDVDGSPEWTAP